MGAFKEMSVRKPLDSFKPSNHEDAVATKTFPGYAAEVGGEAPQLWRGSSVSQSVDGFVCVITVVKPANCTAPWRLHDTEAG